MAPTESSTDNQIPVPTSLTSSSESLPPLTSHLLVSHLRQNDAISDLTALLTDSLARTGWTDRVRALALELLRNGTCDTFPDLLEEVLRRAKIPKGTGNEGRNGGGSTGGKSVPNGTGNGPTSAPGSQATNVNGVGSIAVREGWFGADGLPDVRIPEKTVEVGVEFLKEKIVDVVQPVDDD